jgi:hypothetical protein
MEFPPEVEDRMAGKAHFNPKMVFSKPFFYNAGAASRRKSR